MRSGEIDLIYNLVNFITLEVRQSNHSNHWQSSKLTRSKHVTKISAVFSQYYRRHKCDLATCYIARAIDINSIAYSI